MSDIFAIIGTVLLHSVHFFYFKHCSLGWTVFYRHSGNTKLYVLNMLFVCFILLILVRIHWVLFRTVSEARGNFSISNLPLD